MDDVLKIKHLIWTIGGMLVFAFGLGMNVNSKLSQVDINTKDIIEIKDEYHQSIVIVQRNQTKILEEFAELRLELKLELKDKLDR